MNRKIHLNILPWILAVFSVQTIAQEQIGVASAVNKNTSDITLTQERKLIDAGYKIIQNHTLETDAIGKAQMLLLDGTTFSVGPNSSVLLDKFIYNPQTADGSLEITAKGLLRIVGGKVTKKKPVLIRTNSATVGIRGGIGVVQTNGTQTTATFLYGDEMTVTPNCTDLDTFGDSACSPDSGVTITEPGFSVTVESEDSEPSEPEPVTAESLEEIQDSLEGNDEEESPEEESTEENPLQEESTQEETPDGESTEETPDGEASEESTAEEASDQESTEETPDGEASEESTAEEASDQESTEEESSQIEVDESMVDSSGVSENSSAEEPDDLGSADEYEADIDDQTTSADDANDNPAEDAEEETAESSQEAATEVAPVFDVNDETLIAEVDENVSNIDLILLTLVNPGELDFTVTISGRDADLISFDRERSCLVLNQDLDFETQETLEFSISIESSNSDVREFSYSINIIDINEPVEIDINQLAESFLEDLDLNSVLAEIQANDPENAEITFSLSGEGSDKFQVDKNGNLILIADLDYETQTEYALTLIISDGENTTEFQFSFSILDVDEPASLESTLFATEFLEDVAIGTTFVTNVAVDPEDGQLTYTLSGEGSENFTIDENGNITSTSLLDYETAASYTFFINVSDGVHTTTNVITIVVADVNEAPSLSSTLAQDSFDENIASGTSIASVSASDPESGSLTYSLSGTGSNLFSIDANGNITLTGGLDYESATSYDLVITVSDGVNQTSETITISVADVNEAPSLSSTLAQDSFDENIASGTSIASVSASDPESGSLTYSLSGTGSNLFSIDANGNITLTGGLDYESATSYDLVITVSDGVNQTSETITITINDIIELSIALANSSVSISENVTSGTSITTTTTTTDGSGAVTYSLSGTGSDQFSVSSDGTITTNGSFDFETTSSYSITLTATDGTNTVSQVLTVNIINEVINGLSVTLANSGAAIGENSSSGTSVASSSINNPDSDSITYSLSGTGSSNFTVDSSGNVTTNATLDFETAKSYTITLTATTGDTTVTDTFTVNIGNVEELQSAVLRYSAAYNSASRSGFSVTATRGPSGSSLPAYYLEQVGTTNSTAMNDVVDVGNGYVPVEISSGTQLNWRYYFPIEHSGDGRYAFAPNHATVDGKYYSLLGTNVTTTISNSEFITAGRLRGNKYWFMTTDKAGSDITFTSAASGGKALILWSYPYGYDGDYGSASNQWVDAITADGKTYDVVFSTSVPADLSSYSLIIDLRLNTTTSDISGYETFLETPGNVLYVLYSEQCCESTSNESRLNAILAAIGGGTATFTARDDITDTEPIDSTYTGSGGIAEGLNGYSIYCNGCGSYLNSAGNGIKLAKFMGYWGPDQTDSDTNGILISVSDINWDHTNTGSANNYAIMQWIVGLSGDGTTTASTYNLYEDQVTLAGEVYKDANFLSFTNGNKRVIAMAVIPIENFAASGSSNDYFYPNFIPTTFWSYGDVGHDYCLGFGYSSTQCNEYDRYYEFSTSALDDVSLFIDTSRFYGSTNELPEGQSMWWQVLNPNGIGVGLWAQISFKDSYDGASGNTTRDDQQSLLNVVISNIDYRKNDTTRYSAGDTGLGMDGYHYWSYQGATNADNDGLGINYGTSPVECATSNDSGCFWGDSSNQPGGAMFTSSDPYKSGDMTLGVNYNSNTDSFSTGTFNISAVVQDVRPSSSSYADYASLSDFRSSDFYTSSASGYSGFFSGILEFDVSGSGNGQLSSIRSSSTLASFTFDSTNDDVQVVAPMTVSAVPSNNYTSTWAAVDTGSITLKFGDATNDEAKSAYISSEVFGAEIQDNGAQIDGTSGGSNNLAGVMVSYNTLDKEDTDLFHSGGNDSMPDTEYSTWGFWAMGAVDISPNAGTQNAAVHLGTWVAGELVDQSEIPTSGSASMSGAAVMSVAYRYNQTGTNYDVHKYTTTADVAATFNWGSSGYSGTLDFTNFDDKNPIIANAGFASFSVAITGTTNTYSGSSTDSLDNGRYPDYRLNYLNKYWLCQ